MLPTYIRFVTHDLDGDSGRRRGILQAAFALIDSNVLLDFELDEVQSLTGWFADELKAPDNFSRSQKSGAASTAICWFKSVAVEHVSRMHAICRILNDHGIGTEMLRSTWPGYIVFEDDYQVAAVPFADTVT